MRVPNPAASIEQRLLLLRLLRGGPRTRRELSDQSGYSVSLVRQLLSDLVERGWVLEHGTVAPDARGRPSQAWALAPDACLTIGLDVGGDTSRVMALDAAGTVRYRQLVPTPALDSGHALLGFLAGLVRHAESALGPPAQNVRRLGVSYSGFIDFQAGYVIAAPNIIAGDRLPLRDYLQEALGLPALVEDSSRVMTLAEMRYGAGQGCTDALCVNVGAGIGMGILAGGQLYRGGTGLAGEIGHIPMQPYGDRCRCGGQGCLETLASGRAIATRARHMLEQGMPSLLQRMTNGAPALVTTEMVAHAAQAGDDLALDLLNSAGMWLGMALATVLNLFAPQRVILTGGVMRGNDLLLSIVRESAERYTLPHAARPLPIVLTQLSDDVGALGAALLALDEEFDRGFAWRLAAESPAMDEG
ncbi:MAG: ROK family protein [Anaerolineae bacterium]|nr:ROK family protein [Anaerolineae bacterium]